MKCKCCGKSPSELKEYKMHSKIAGYDSPEDFVRNEEGTFNPETEEFYCTNCYVELGCPSGIA